MHDWPALLREAQFLCAGTCDDTALMHALGAHDPDLVLVWRPPSHQPMLDALAGGASDGCAWLVCSDLDDGAQAIERAVQAGVHAWMAIDATPPAPHRLRSALCFALACARQQALVQAQLAEARGRLDERKWVERAKGVLMQARRIGEDEAFRLLRDASMHAQLRVGEVSRAVIDAARVAEGVNRAGQLRMLSQRLVRLAAQRLARIDTASATAALASNSERVTQTLDGLLQGASGGAVQQLEVVRVAWQALHALLRQRGASAANLAAADAAAESLLDAAEGLTAALQAQGGRRAVQIVNLCGRQRMRAQRIAKDVLLGVLLAGEAAAAARTRAERTAVQFEQTLAELEQAPLTSASIRAGLAAAREEWLRMQHGIRGAATVEGRTALAASSERLLEHFEALTNAYETSLQVILGG